MGSITESTGLEKSWVLWYHDPENKDYSLAGYKEFPAITTIQEFWSIVDSISKEKWESGMFFFMKQGVLPLWESTENKNGGTWSKKIDSSTVHTAFIDLMVHCISGEMLVDKKNTLVGVSTSPKGPSSIIKIWNSDTRVHDRRVINPRLAYYKVSDDVSYTPHKSRPV